MSKSEELEILFKKWIKEQKQENNNMFQLTKGDTIKIKKGTFCRDGIIDEDIFENSKINPQRVLFITNEPNYDEEGGGNRIDDFYNYYKSGDKKWKEEMQKNQNIDPLSIIAKDEWRGKLREKICAMYKAILKEYNVPEWKVARNFAFMNINKRGGSKTINDGNKKYNARNHIEEYCDLYKDNIRKEITIINPDIIVWLSCKTYDLNLHTKYLGAEQKKDGKIYLNGAPILRIDHPSYAHTLKIKEPNEHFRTRTLGKLATKVQQELKRYNLD